MKSKGILSGNVRQNGMIIALLIIIAGFGIATGGTLFRPMNINNIFLQNSFEIILAIGMFFCILTGGNVDLSVGAIVGFSGALMGVLTVNYGVSTPVAVVVTLFSGLVIGAVQGSFIAFLNVPPFIATLAGQLIFRGLCQFILGGQSLSPFSQNFQFFANGFLFTNVKVFGVNLLCVLILAVGVLAVAMAEVVKRRNRRKHGFSVTPVAASALKVAFLAAVMGFIMLSLSAYNGMPFIVLVLVGLSVIYSFIAMKTTIGRHVYMTGGSLEAARLSGVRTKWVMFAVYVNSAFLAAIAGLVVTGRLNVASPKAGNGFELDAIAACMIGGASGATGSVLGAIIGACVIAILNNGMSILGIGTDMQQVIKGCILLLAVTFDVYSKSKSEN